jgi:hypothetical protein
MNKRSSRRFYLTAAACGLAFFLAAAGLAQQIIENPAKPPSPQAGRVIPLKEIARVSEEPGKFFFEQPWDLFAGRDGSIYVQEPKKLYKFDADCRFVKNLLKWGEGPGELSGNLTDVLVRDKDILLYSSNIYKLLRLDLDGKLLGETRFVAGFSRLLGSSGGRYAVMRFERKDIPRTNGIVEQDFRLAFMTENGDIDDTPHVFPLTHAWYVRTIGGRASGGSSLISRFMPLPVDDRFVFLFHSPEYLIRVIDLEKGELVQSFRRKYDRVEFKHAVPKNMPDYPFPKYHNDLCRLLWRDGQLWAVTSTFDKSKGLLVDVFSREGRYLDNFYLPLLNIRRNNPQYNIPMAVWGDFLYVLEPDEDDITSLVKYEIGGERRPSNDQPNMAWLHDPRERGPV